MRALRGFGTGGRERHAGIRALVGDLQVPVPWSLPAMVESVARRTGRRILLHPLHDMPPEISGVSVPASDAEDEHTFVVCYDARVPRWSQTMIVLHELGHHLLGHSHRRPLCLPDLADRGRLGTRRPGAVLRGLARTSFTDPAEVEAEHFATLLLDRIERQQRIELAPQLRGIRAGIEPPHAWRRGTAATPGR